MILILILDYSTLAVYYSMHVQKVMRAVKKALPRAKYLRAF